MQGAIGVQAGRGVVRGIILVESAGRRCVLPGLANYTSQPCDRCGRRAPQCEASGPSTSRSDRTGPTGRAQGLRGLRVRRGGAESRSVCL